MVQKEIEREGDKERGRERALGSLRCSYLELR